MIPRLYATSFVVSQVATYHAVLRSLRAVLEVDLQVGFHPHTRPPDMACSFGGRAVVLPAGEVVERLVHAVQVRERVQLRRYETESSRQALQEEFSKELRTFFNGDWRLASVQHFCFEQGCCKGRSPAVALERAFALAVEFIFAPLCSTLPAESRWSTFGPALARQSGGHLLHSLLPRVLQHAFGTGGAAQPAGANAANADENSWHAFVQKKVKQAVDFHVANRAEGKQALLVALLTTAPIDELSARLQKLDHVGGSVSEIISPKGALHRCQKRLWTVANAWQMVSPDGATVAAIWRHLEDMPNSLDLLHASVLNVGASVWARLEVEYTGWPWLLLNGIMSGPAGDASQLALDIHRRFFEEDACCLDAAFSLPLRRTLRRPEDLQSPQLQALLVQLRRKVLATNMLLEGILSQIKAAVPNTPRNGLPLAEKLCYLGLLSQVLHSHIEKGRIGPRSCKPGVETLKAMGLLDRAAAPLPAKRPDTTLRNHMRSTVVRRRVALQLDSGGAAQPAEAEAGDAATGGAAQPAELAEWPLGSNAWPVTPECLEQFLQSAGSSHGVASKMPRIRWANRDAVLMEDKGLIGPTEKFDRRFSCAQAHPGLCRTKHAAYYQDALRLAWHIERGFTAADLGHYFLFDCPAEDAWWREGVVGGGGGVLVVAVAVVVARVSMAVAVMVAMVVVVGGGGWWWVVAGGGSASREPRMSLARPPALFCTIIILLSCSFYYATTLLCRIIILL